MKKKTLSMAIMSIVLLSTMFSFIPNAMSVGSVQVTVTVLTVELLQDQDDGVDGNAELVLGVNVGNPCGTTRTFTIDDLNWDVTHVWSINQVVCKCKTEPPFTGVDVAFVLTEVDTTATESIAITLASGLAGAGVGLWLGGLPGAGVGFVVGAVPGVIAALNGNDDLGLYGATRGAGTQSFTLNGPDGSAKVSFKVDIEEEPEPPPPDEPKPLPDNGRGFYYNLSGAYALTPQIDIEPGNPAHLTEHDSSEFRYALSSLLIDVSDVYTASVIFDSSNLQGIDTAYSLFLDARALATVGNFAEAINKYYEAFNATMDAIQINQTGPLLTTLTMGIVPTFQTVNQRRSAPVGVAIYGTENKPIEVSFSGLPSGSTLTLDQSFTISQALFNTNHITTTHETSLGSYDLTITADKEGTIVSRDKKLVVKPSKEKAVGGIVVPVDKLTLLAPHIGLASTILVGTAAIAIYVKRVKRRKEKQ